MAKFIDTKAMEWRKSPVNTDVLVVRGNNIGGLIARLDKGATMDPHQHVQEQLGFVIEGAVEWIVGPDRDHCITEAGAFYFFESNELHGISNTLEKTVLVDMFGPPNEALDPIAVRMHK